MSEPVDEEEKAIAKALRLRAPPQPVTRLSRKALVACSAVLAVGVAGALSWSLMEHKRKPAEPAFVPAASPPERIANLPRDYAGRPGAPTLGPPLPGDLGRPMLSSQVAQRDDIDSPAAAMADPRLEARREVVTSARASGLFIAVAAPRTSGEEPKAAPEVEMSEASAADPRVTSSERLQAPASPYILQAGAIIPAALVTGLRSDVPGLAIAQVTQDVFDSLGGGHLLIPQGARLVGRYDAMIANGQRRLSVFWDRLILPSGRSILLDQLPGADAQGMAGLQDEVDVHGWEILGASGLSTLLAIGAEAGNSDESDVVRALRRGGAQSVSDVGQQIVGRSLARAPTLMIRPGAPLRVLLTRDVILEPYGEDS